MKDLKYCIWFCPDGYHPWNYFTSRFPVHLSLKTNLNYSTALNLFTKIKKQDIEVEFDNLMCDEDKNVHTMFYTLKPPKNKPDWWPKNPHISFYYKYNEKILPHEVHQLYYNLKHKKGVLKNIYLMKCSGHHKKWQIIHRK